MSPKTVCGKSLIRQMNTALVTYCTYVNMGVKEKLDGFHAHN